MINRIILYLICRKLGIRKFQEFRFANQKTNATYWFTHDGISKHWNGETTLSHVSLNWLLNPECEIVKIEK